MVLKADPGKPRGPRICEFTLLEHSGMNSMVFIFSDERHFDTNAMRELKASGVRA